MPVNVKSIIIMSIWNILAVVLWEVIKSKLLGTIKINKKVKLALRTTYTVIIVFVYYGKKELVISKLLWILF